MLRERRRHAHYKLNSRLDRKSSRGMIYENEELRLRTININAEVERGQTDIKRLRKENEQLRREIWTLRDECDRLNKRVKAKFIEHEQGVYSVRCSGGNGCSCQCNEAGNGCEGIQCRCNSEDSDSCDSCCCHEEEINPCQEECCNEVRKLSNIIEGEVSSAVANHNITTIATATAAKEAPSAVLNKLTSFDHLSVVSEETLSNSEVVLAQQSENHLRFTPDFCSSQTNLPSLVRPLTPLTPVELVANELHDLQAVVPPLSYFENILHQHTNTSYGSTPESSSTTISGKTLVKHTNGWDYKLESPFAQRQYQGNSISPIMTKRLPAQTLTTFVPSTPTTPISPTNANEKPALPKKPTELGVTHSAPQPSFIETVPITTLPPNGCGPQGTAATNSKEKNGSKTPRHFFAPIKPKLKLNTALANQKRMPPPPLPPVTTSISEVQSQVPQHKCEPPDIYVTNALASPYRPPNKPPPIPQRLSSASTTQAQVSSGPHQRNRQQQPHHRRQHQIRCYQHPHPNDVVATNNNAYIMPAIYNATTSINATNTATTNTTITTMAVLTYTNNLYSSMQTNLNNFFPPLTTTVLAPNTLCNSLNTLLTMPITTPDATLSSETVTPFSMAYLETGTCPNMACFKFINSNINFRKPNDPVYAIAQNVCHNLITASAVTQPLMSSIVKCCTAKLHQQQQQQQPLPIQQFQTITVPSNLSTAKTFHTRTAAFTADNNADGKAVVVMTSLPSAQHIAAAAPGAASSSSSLLCSSMAKLSSVSCSLAINSSFLSPQTISNMSTSFIVVDSMCQTDSANLESILNDIEAISEDILAIQLVKNKTHDNIGSKSTDSINKTEPASTLKQGNKNTKPYRSEMNLQLAYESDSPTIKPSAESTFPTNNIKLTESLSGNNTMRRARSLEREHTDSESPHIPDPMQPFPENRKYIGFDHINKAAASAVSSSTPLVAATATQTSPVLNSPLGQRPHLPLSPLVTNVNTSKSLNNKQLPPTPPIRSYPAPLNIKCAGIARSSSLTGCLPPIENSSTKSGMVATVAPNKSQLYAALANAAAKRAQFRSQPTQMTRSLDIEEQDKANEEDKNIANDEKESLENSNRKARIVSIVCGDTDSPESPEKPLPASRTHIDFQPMASGSCTDLHAAMQNPALRNLKQTSQSTPNSPHSSRKHESSPQPTTPVPPTIEITPNSTPQHQRNSSNTSGMSQLLAHNHAHSNSYPNVISPLTQQQKVRKCSQDTIRASAAEIACAAANAMRSKCSRRHSDSTVSHGNQRISGVSAGTNGTHHHHLHNHHHRQHSSSLASNVNPHHSHHSRRDSNQETVASYSDRNSNSLASSRESSASFSMRSQRRKLSISSHTGGKIPWCGCWGNGCL